jgi:hypothetical protein
MDDEGHGLETGVPDVPQAALVQHDGIDPARGQVGHQLIDASSSPRDRAVGDGMVERDDGQFASVPEHPVQAHGPGEMMASEQGIAGFRAAGRIAAMAKRGYVIERDSRL